MKTFPAVLLQLNLFNVDIFFDHLIPLFSSNKTVNQLAVYCDGSPLLSDLVSSLKFENPYEKLWSKQTQNEYICQ